MQVDRDAPERAAPFHHRRVEVRMRDSDSLQATEAVNQGNGRRIQHRNAVPQNISIGCANNQRTLADRKLSYWRYELKCPAVRAASVVQVCPRGGTYCRSSSQITHCRGATLLGVYWVPQAVQMNASISLFRELGFIVDYRPSRPVSARIYQPEIMNH